MPSLRLVVLISLFCVCYELVLIIWCFFQVSPLLNESWPAHCNYFHYPMGGHTFHLLYSAQRGLLSTVVFSGIPMVLTTIEDKCFSISLVRKILTA